MDQSERLHLEILALLLQVAWADDEVEIGESSQILAGARAVGLDDDTLARLDACLRGEATLPPPDLGFLRDHRDEALRAVEQLVSGGVSEDEAPVMEQVRLLLGA